MIYSKATKCHCGDGCARNPKCPCKIINLKCGMFCHDKKAFNKEKPCSTWGAQPIALAQIRNSTETVHAEEVVAAPKQRHMQNRGEMAREGMRRFDESDEEEQEYQPEAKRQSRGTSKVLLPQTIPTKLNKRQQQRACKPCTNCGRSGMRTFSLGPTGSTLCSNCNKKIGRASCRERVF